MFDKTTLSILFVVFESTSRFDLRFDIYFGLLFLLVGFQLDYRWAHSKLQTTVVCNHTTRVPGIMLTTMIVSTMNAYSWAMISQPAQMPELLKTTCDHGLPFVGLSAGCHRQSA
jgi:hypothetical protein